VTAIKDMGVKRSDVLKNHGWRIAFKSGRCAYWTDPSSKEVLEETVAYHRLLGRTNRRPVESVPIVRGVRESCLRQSAAKEKP
jgi:hypothetical protein